MTQPYQTITYYALALDPIHVGTGGYRLGRVDLSIVRETGTNVPKIPGTSLSGTTRAYAAMATGRYAWQETRKGKQVRGSCAGQGQEDREIGQAGHCGKPYCPVCVTFGFARGERGGFQGLAQFADARILFFPVHSLIGPVWISSPSILAEHGIPVNVSPDTIKLVDGLTVAKNRLNLGWLMLTTDSKDGFSLGEQVLPAIPKEVKNRVVVVSDKLLGQIVNDNLEVRTSVSIDPASGAAAEGALFTYEALPRATVLWFPITYSDPKFFRIRHNAQQVQPAPHQGATESDPSLTVRQVAERGLAMLEHLGVGGMNTRGMGRLKVLDLAGAVATTNQSSGSPVGNSIGGER